MVKAVFFDRDGTLNELVKHGDIYTAPWSFNEFKVIKGSKKTILDIKTLGYKIFVVTNQPDYLDGNLSKQDLEKINKKIIDCFNVDGYMFALKRGSPDYKPNNGMIEKLIYHNNISRHKSFLVGDRWKDIVAGHKSGLTTIFIGNKYDTPDTYKEIYPDYIVKNISQVSELIMELDNDNQDLCRRSFLQGDLRSSQ